MYFSTRHSAGPIQCPDSCIFRCCLSLTAKESCQKRDGDRLGFPVFPLEWHDPKSGEISSGYREKGYLPDAVVNFLALLGWNPGDDTEIMSMDELIKKFSFDHCSRAGAKFAFEKANGSTIHTFKRSQMKSLLSCSCLCLPKKVSTQQTSPPTI